MQQMMNNQEMLQGELTRVQRRCDQLDIGALEVGIPKFQYLRTLNVLQGLEEVLIETKSDLFKYKKNVVELEQEMTDKEHEIRKLLNVIIDLKGAIRVYVRVRPVSSTAGQLVVHTPMDRKILISELDTLTPGIRVSTYTFCYK